MKNVLVIGAGISGLGAAHVLLRHECNVIVSDLKDNIKDKKEKEILQSFGVVFEFGMQSVELLMESIRLWFHQLFLLRI